LKRCGFQAAREFRRALLPAQHGKDGLDMPARAREQVVVEHVPPLGDRRKGRGHRVPFPDPAEPAPARASARRDRVSPLAVSARGWDTPDPRTGEPPGIDKGWGYAPGAKAATPLLDIVSEKLVKLDAPIGAAMWEALAPAIAMEQGLALKEMVDRIAATLRPQGKAVLVGGISSPIVAAFAEKAGKEIESADLWLRDAELAHALRDIKTARGAALSIQTWRSLPALLKSADVWYDRNNDALVYVFAAEHGKVAARVNYTSKLSGGDGKKRRVLGNFIKTGGIVGTEKLGEPQYVWLGRGDGGGI